MTVKLECFIETDCRMRLSLRPHLVGFTPFCNYDSKITISPTPGGALTLKLSNHRPQMKNKTWFSTRSFRHSDSSLRAFVMNKNKVS